MSGTRWPEAVVDTLYVKCRRALRETGLKRLVAAGGVSANRALRGRLGGLAEELGVTVHYPRPELCTDNGAMVAYAGYRRLSRGERAPLAFEVRATLAARGLDLRLARQRRYSRRAPIFLSVPAKRFRIAAPTAGPRARR